MCPLVPHHYMGTPGMGAHKPGSVPSCLGGVRKQEQESEVKAACSVRLSTKLCCTVRTYKMSLILGAKNHTQVADAAHLLKVW